MDFLFHRLISSPAEHGRKKIVRVTVRINGVKAITVRTVLPELLWILLIWLLDWWAWLKTGTATFYGGPDGSGTMGGACGYGNTYEKGYGINTTALSTTLFSNGQTCGACYQVQCLNASQHCSTANAITVTVIDWCPSGGWCTPPRQHFDMSQPAFGHIGIYDAGIIPIAFRRVRCVKSGGIRYTINGSPNFNLVLVTNVAGAGDVVAVWLNGEFTEWKQMTRNWGQNWQNGDNLNYQSLSFRVMTSDQAVVTNWNVVPRGWQFGQTVEGDQNFS